MDKTRLACRSSRRTVLAALLAAPLAHTSVARASEGVRIRVRDHGAQGDGITDDTRFIQAAMDAAAAAGGGAVVFDQPKRFYKVSSPLIMRSTVSLIGDGSYPELRSTDASGQMLYPGNFHPDFLERLKVDRLSPYAAGARQVKLASGSATNRYRPGDQVFISSVRKGTNGTFAVPEYGWLNYVTQVDGSRITLREPLDVAVAAEIGPLKGTMARRGIPLFFWADGTVEGLTFSTPGDFTSDTAALNCVFRDNRVTSRRGVYGNTFQKVSWLANDFAFSESLGELSLNSIFTKVAGNRFHYVGGKSDDNKRRRQTGLYIHEFARHLLISDNKAEMNDFQAGNFCLSLQQCQYVTVRRMAFSGKDTPTLIGMFAKATPSFQMTGNRIEECTFANGVSLRFVMLDGGGSSYMHDNAIVRCRFTGSTKVGDAFRMNRVEGVFDFSDNVWSGTGNCINPGPGNGMRARGNARAGRAMGACLKL